MLFLICDALSHKLGKLIIVFLKQCMTVFNLELIAYRIDKLYYLNYAIQKFKSDNDA